MHDRRSSSYRSAQIGLSLEESFDLLMEKLSGFDPGKPDHVYQMARLKKKIAAMETPTPSKHQGNK